MLILMRLIMWPFSLLLYLMYLIRFLRLVYCALCGGHQADHALASAKSAAQYHAHGG